MSKKTKSQASGPVVVHFNAPVSEADVGSMRKRQGTKADK